MCFGRRSEIWNWQEPGFGVSLQYVSSEERRAHERKSLRTPIGIDAESRKDRAGITRNMSASGVLFHSPSRFSIGEELELYFRSRDGGEQRYTGRVVRTGTDPDVHTIFPHVTAVAFDEPVDHIPDDRAA